MMIIYSTAFYLLALSSTFAKAQTQQIFFPEERVSSPKIDFECGQQFESLPYHLILNESDWDATETAYFYNKTADDLRERGFEVTVEKVIFHDVLCNFSYSNGTYKGRYLCYDFYQRDRIIGGVAAPIARSYYMAQLGQKKGEKIKWLCDGVLINREWVLSAAHCFVSPGQEPNLLRLGDYNLNESEDNHIPGKTKVIFDYPFAQIVPHPEFEPSQRYNDLVLIRIPREIPRFASNVKPICLPWERRVEHNHVGNTVSLTGWGATYYGGPKTAILQTVDLKVFNSSVCEASYSRLTETKTKFPKGFASDTVLCVGWDEEGRDACNGDSGGPLAFSTPEETYSLVGVVSGGYGCGLKEFPGLYTPINTKNLQWIKRVAFNNYV